MKPETPDMDAVRVGLSAVTGMKAQLVEMGWSERGAEEAVVALIRSGQQS